MIAYSYDMCKCGQCQAHFPKSWLADLKKSGAAKYGTIPFCSEKCKVTYVSNLTATLFGTRINPTLA